MSRRSLLVAMGAGLALVVVCSMAAQAHAKNSTPSDVTVQTLAQGTVAKLPAGKLFVNILDFHQVPDSTFKLAARATGIEYTVHGIATISSPGTPTRSVGQGGAAFLPSLAVQTIGNVNGRVGAGAIAVGLIVVVILLRAATWLRGGLQRATIAGLSSLLIAAGIWVLLGATTNEWYLIVVRSIQLRSAPMPVPYGAVSFSSADLDPLPSAPCTEMMNAITVPPGARYDALNNGGPEMIIVVEGRATVHAGGDVQQLVSGGAAFAQTANTLSIVNSGSDTLRVLDFAITALAVPG
jgi:hypothetical protein